MGAEMSVQGNLIGAILVPLAVVVLLTMASALAVRVTVQWAARKVLR